MSTPSSFITSDAGLKGGGVSEAAEAETSPPADGNRQALVQNTSTAATNLEVSGPGLTSNTTESAPAISAVPSGVAAPGTGYGADVTGTASGAATLSSSATPSVPTAELPTDQAVLEYLRKKGLGSAALELQAILETDQNKPKSDNKSSALIIQPSKPDIFDTDDNQQSVTTKSTGDGGYGYDRDAAWPVLQWGVPDTGRYSSSATVTAEGTDSQSVNTNTLGVDEARAYLDAFCSLQLWVLSLPDEDGRQIVQNPIKRAHQLLKADKDVTLKSMIDEIISKQPVSQTSVKDRKDLTEYNLPPSAKAELLSVTFALLVHTYCELLEVGMETTAHMLRDAFRPVYESLYHAEYRDLYQCTTIDDIMRLNQNNSQYMESLSNLKAILVQSASYQSRREELIAQSADGGNVLDANQRAIREQKLQEYDRNITILKQKHEALGQKASALFEKMHNLPFLRRARAVRWQLTLSTTTYGMLAAFFNTKDDSLLVMSTLLHVKCELRVEHRAPLPFTPACALDESSSNDELALDINKHDIQWAAPSASLKNTSEKISFPKYYLDEEYEDELQASKDKRIVEFNRTMLINGFRRLEALERKRDFESLAPSTKKRLKNGEQPISTISNPLEPSILLTTLCASSSGPGLQPVPATSSSLTRINGTDISAIWEEAGINSCCARLSTPDGRRIAVGCDDAAIRIWDLRDYTRQSEPSAVLLGHKNGFPVFDVNWNRDGRTLLSAGGDGSVRLWDTKAAGPFGEVAEIQPAKTASGGKPLVSSSDDIDDPTAYSGMNVPGLRSEKSKYNCGAALAVYRGHVPSSPVWSVSFAPCGYYFVSSGADATARLWATDRPVPLRLLTGHTASNVNCVEWHPNCNFVISGSDDKTVRLWDIHSGRTVRLLDGCASGVNLVQISPDGRYAAGADYNGVVHLWDIGMGKKLTEFKTPQTKPILGAINRQSKVLHRLTFSACGTALATGGDDCCVRIWDLRSESIAGKKVIEIPAKIFATRQTLLLDLYYTKRNLLLSLGKFVTPIRQSNVSRG